MAWRLGVDIGGTFADFSALEIETGRLKSLKVLTTPMRPGDDVAEGIRQLEGAGMSVSDINRLVHGTTVGVNAIIQRSGARLALFTTFGMTDMLELARLRMPNVYSLFCERPAPLIAREHVFPIRERMGSLGETIVAPDEESVREAITLAKVAGCEGVVVSFLHAWRNPTHEIEVVAMVEDIAPELFVFRGSEVWPSIREYERTTTAVVNAYVHPRVDAYLHQVEARLKEASITAPLLLTTSVGGTMTAEKGRRDCVGMLLSGTASGVVGAGLIAKTAGLKSVLTLDIGGTSADIALLTGGMPAFGAGQTIGDFPLSVPTVAVVSSGQGGGSIARVDEQGVLQVGPESAGSTPGPACFGRGGSACTVTDAALICGILGHGELGFGSIRPDAALAQSAIAPIAASLEMETEAVAEGVLRVAISGMLVEIDKLLARAGVHGAELSLMAFGGAGPMLGALVAEAAGIRKVLIPPGPGTLCAMGALAADLRRDTMRTVLMPLNRWTWPAMKSVLVELANEAEAALKLMNNSSHSEINLSADLHYQGQSYEVNIALPSTTLDEDAEMVEAIFHTAHAEMFGHCDKQALVEVVSLRASARQPAPPISIPSRPLRQHHAEPIGKNLLYLGGSKVTTCIYSRLELEPGAIIDGPAIVIQPDCTTLVPPRWIAITDEFGNLVMEQA
ncbi:hydantoinase/oxoprolinase family protein [Agrobacterium sp. LAD9]|uniref:hydantoinase/oxoprolinase family protein n=1 Tax=Agrobacterium sp. LAD9 TaxID=2055153 RepID=UPI000D1DFA89|nr:hydantoinase/oxoprolinase family protein [Agrobacterium sp. LAD9]